MFPDLRRQYVITSYSIHYTKLYEASSYGRSFSQITNVSLHRDSPFEGFFRLKFIKSEEKPMYYKYLKFALFGVAFGMLLSNINQLKATESEATPPPRDIPGIT